MSVMYFRKHLAVSGAAISSEPNSKKSLVWTGCLHGTAKSAWSGQAACMGQQKGPGRDRLPAWDSKKSLVGSGCLHRTAKRAWSGQAACMEQQKEPGLDRLPAWDRKKGLVWTGCLHGTAKRAWSGQAACMGCTGLSAERVKSFQGF